MKPGDLFEWVYVLGDTPVVPHERLWSSIEKRFVPMGGIHLLVSHADGVLSWLPLGEGKGLFHAREDDTRTKPFWTKEIWVVPRARG